MFSVFRNSNAEARTLRWRRSVSGVATAVMLMLLTLGAEAAEPSETRRGGRRVGIDTRFGELVRDARKEYYKKNYARAVSLYTEALDMRPDRKNAVMLYNARGYAHVDGQNHLAAVADFDAVVRLMPADSTALNMAAWLRATSPNAAARNGRLAVQQATRACELTSWKDSDLVDTLAAAHAEAGNFDRAMDFQKQAIRIAPLADRNKMHERLRLFQQRTPYRLKSTGR